MATTKGKDSGKYLRDAINMADTGSVVNTVTSHNAAMGRMAGPEDRRGYKPVIRSNDKRARSR